MTARVAVIGGGWAGMAAAVALAAAGREVTVFEAGAVLGGRARRVMRSGLPLDNGQHLLLGAYSATFALLRQIGAGQGQLTRRPLTLLPIAADAPDALSLVARTAPGRLGLLAGLLGAQGLSWRERLANLAWFRAVERSGYRRPPQETVARMLAPLPPRVARLLWEPLCIAALNTPPAQASAQVFANVLGAAFGTTADASDFVLPATDLSALLPEPAARWLESRGGRLLCQRQAQVVAAARDGVVLAAGGVPHGFDAVVVAVGPHQLDGAFATELRLRHGALDAALQSLAALTFEPIVTVWLGFAQRLDLPAPIVRLDDAPGQWLVNRPDILARAEPDPTRPPLAQLVAAIISMQGAHTALSATTLVAKVLAQLIRARPDRPECVWSQVITEQRATYACTPGRVRPGGTRLATGIYLAGDYVDADFPATLEAAVRSGNAAAAALLADA